jgi:acetylglutamate kinase
MQKLTVVKIGGNIIDDRERLADFLSSFSRLQGNKILIHGGGKVATEMGTKLGIKANYHNGRRITDKETLELVTMVYGGLINKTIVAQLQAIGANAIGLTGADGKIMSAQKRPVKDIDYGFVGDMNKDSINTAFLNSLLHAGALPVIAPLTYNEGTLLNTNADTIANEIAKAMSAIMEVQLVFCFEQKGVLLDIQDPDSLIKQINKQDFEGLKAKQVITDGMIPKLENAFEAINSGVKSVKVGQAEELEELVNGTKGTTIS